ncbi:hypothetical protein SAMN02927924_00162 [Sphingobium faniae]|nr:hypothetical protein SAMN02927924_00162 [Sphingobium faniae]
MIDKSAQLETVKSLKGADFGSVGRAATALSFAEKAERSVQWLSRWAGVAAFAMALGALILALI